MENNIQHDVTAQATTKAAKAKKSKPSVKKATKAKVSITGTQYRTLKAISKKPLTRKGISEAAFNGNSINFVPILEPLVKAKLVTPHELDIDGKTETVFQATTAGRKIAEGPAPVTARGNGANHESLPKAGKTFVKTYLGKEYTVKVNADGTFTVGKKTYTSLTAAAKGVRGSEQEVNGWAFFGLVKAKAE